MNKFEQDYDKAGFYSALQSKGFLPNALPVNVDSKMKQIMNEFTTKRFKEFKPDSLDKLSDHDKIAQYPTYKMERNIAEYRKGKMTKEDLVESYTIFEQEDLNAKKLVSEIKDGKYLQTSSFQSLINQQKDEINPRFIDEESIKKREQLLAPKHLVEQSLQKAGKNLSIEALDSITNDYTKAQQLKSSFKRNNKDEYKQASYDRLHVKKDPVMDHLNDAIRKNEYKDYYNDTKYVSDELSAVKKAYSDRRTYSSGDVKRYDEKMDARTAREIHLLRVKEGYDPDAYRMSHEGLESVNLYTLQTMNFEHAKLKTGNYTKKETEKALYDFRSGDMNENDFRKKYAELNGIDLNQNLILEEKPKRTLDSIREKRKQLVQENPDQPKYENPVTKRIMDDIRAKKALRQENQKPDVEDNLPTQQTAKPALIHKNLEFEAWLEDKKKQEPAQKPEQDRKLKFRL